MTSLRVKFGDLAWDTRSRTRGRCDPASVVKIGDATLVRGQVKHVSVVGHELSLAAAQHHCQVVLIACVGWDIRNITMILVLIVVRGLVCCFDHVTNGGRAALEDELILGCRAAHAALGCRIEGLGEYVQDFLPILREVVLNPVHDVDIFAVRLLLSQVLMVL